MVTKSRLSPFAISKSRRERKEASSKSNAEASPTSNAKDSNKIEGWLSLIKFKTFPRKKNLQTSLLLSSELHMTLYGLIVFEVSWSNVRGLNYYNELQIDTSLAIETKFMQRWEFDSTDQALSCISSWFSGTFWEQHCLKEYLESTIGEVFFDAEEDFPQDDDNDEGFSIEDNFLYDQCDTFKVYSVTMDSETFEPHTPTIGLHKRRKVTSEIIIAAEVDAYCEESPTQTDNSFDNSDENAVEATEYRDILIYVRFDDRDLPFKLKQIITPDLRLLRLLETGLPSWALFLQSYPGFCHIYRPWMCPLARALYVSISITTVLIGFYDLYKNVPVLKATVFRICGPLFDWIETWEMVSRIKYLGTMLFLHNFQKAVHWLWVILRATRSFFSFINLPLAGPFMELLEFLFPIWSMFSEVIGSFFSIISIVFGFIGTLVRHLMDVLLMPIWFVGLVLSNIVTCILYPLFWIIWGILYAPIRLVLAFASLVVNVCGFIYGFVANIRRSLSGIIQLSSASEAALSNTHEVSMWRSLWNDLFSQIFRALRSILNGFVAFFTACNRHRLSIYNHIVGFVQRRIHGVPRLQGSDPGHNKSTDRNQYPSEVSTSPK